MLLANSVAHGGCKGIKYDCNSTNVVAVLGLYKTHEPPGPPPPEGPAECPTYAYQCLRYQCQGGQKPTAQPQWVWPAQQPGTSISDSLGGSSATPSVRRLRDGAEHLMQF